MYIRAVRPVSHTVRLYANLTLINRLAESVVLIKDYVDDQVDLELNCTHMTYY